MTLSEEERYSRQVRFRQIGVEGQRRLLEAHVAIVGCGALGTLQAGALARSGVGRLTIIDRDYVELSNLQRQWLFDEADVANAVPKAIAAARHIAAANSKCDVQPHVADLTPGNVEELLGGVDLILDGTDNFETRYLINDFAVRDGVPWIYGAAVGSYGICMAIVPGVTSCLTCVYPDPPSGAQPTCETAGVLNSITAMVAAWQTASGTRILVNGEEDSATYLTTFDVWTGRTRQIPQPRRDPDCPTCARREFRHLDQRQRKPISLCGRNAVQIHERKSALDLDALKAELSKIAEVRGNDFALRFFPGDYEITIFPDGRAIIKGTADPGIARSLYAKYVGA